MPSVIWFKRDLRVADHRPLVEAAARGPVIALYVYEPEIIGQAEIDPSHYVFIDECLADLEAELRARGIALTYRYGRMPDVLDELDRTCGGIDAIYSHEETGGSVSYARDRRVGAWCRERGIPWHEFAQFGVFRPLRSRNGWAKAWEARMLERPARAPETMIAANCGGTERRRSLAELGLRASTKREAMRGGSSRAEHVLASFLDLRAVNYRADMSSPVTGWYGCSRLSPYIAFGAISMRTVYQATRKREYDLKRERADGATIDTHWLASLTSFRARLHWHDHFTQKLEDQPSLEFVNVARVYDGMRENDFDDSLFTAWCSGRTGFPMIDACMRALHLGGWINFRMRAMLVSFASYHLWLHWRRTGTYLATQFLDFEPGIHWPQTQMQSGVTGINAVRIYSPTKQAIDNDPTGVFIRRYVPELANVPLAFLAEPHAMPEALARATGFRIGVDYPLPVVDSAAAVARAKERIYTIRKTVAARREASDVYKKHGSRKPAVPRPFARKARYTASADDAAPMLDLDAPP